MTTMGATMSSSYSIAPPNGSPGGFAGLIASSPDSLDGPMPMIIASNSPMPMVMAGRGPFAEFFGDAFVIPRKGPDGLPFPMMFSREPGFPRGPYMKGMLGFQFTQDQGIVTDRSALGPVSNPTASATTTDVEATTTESALQGGAGPGAQTAQGLRLGVDDLTVGRILDPNSNVTPDRLLADAARGMGLNPGAGEAEAAHDLSGDSSRPVATDGDSEPEEVPPPHAAGLMASVLPYDRRSLDKAVDEFLDQLHELNVGSLIEPNPIRVLVASAAVISVGIAVETGRRRLSPRRRRGRLARVWDANESEELLGFPELPGSWSARWI